MVRIAALPDLSRFVRRENKLNIYNTIKLVIGEDFIEVSGCVISQASEILQDLAVNQPELYLDQFVGELEGVQDVVELLYGGEVQLSEDNLKTIMKFSVVFGVDGMYTLCLEWVKQ